MIFLPECFSQDSFTNSVNPSKRNTVLEENFKNNFFSYILIHLLTARWKGVVEQRALPNAFSSVNESISCENKHKQIHKMKHNKYIIYQIYRLIDT